MSESTGISWAKSTFNSWWGCTEVSPECDSCYARRWAHRMGYPWGHKAPRRLLSDKHHEDPLKWNRKAEKTGEFWPVFAQSMSDWADAEVPREWVTRLFDIIRATPHLTWLLLTKRANRIASLLPEDWGKGWPHVWMGTTVGHEDSLWRLDDLLTIPAVVHWVSAEPLLTALDIRPWLSNGTEQGIKWVVVGSESGAKRRSMQQEWALDLLIQCGLHRSAFYMKQMEIAGKVMDDISVFPTMLQIREYPL